MKDEPLQVETTGETVGEAKWQALRELERLSPGLDKARVRFQVISEGERGLLGVGYTPARVIATAEPRASAAGGETEEAAHARELVARIVETLGVRCRIDVTENEDTITVLCSGSDLGLLIGRHGQTIDAVQYLVNAIAFRQAGLGRKSVVVDAAGYRSRRESTLAALAARTAEQVVATGRPVALEPMTSSERKIVHLHLHGHDGVKTTSEGTEPSRHVVISPAHEPTVPPRAASVDS